MALIQLGRAPQTQNVVTVVNNEAIEVAVGQKCQRISFAFVGSVVGQYALTGTEGSALGADAIPVLVADEFFEQRLDMGNNSNGSIFFQVTAGGPTTIRLITESF